jgi:hypothetical protein
MHRMPFQTLHTILIVQPVSHQINSSLRNKYNGKLLKKLEELRHMPATTRQSSQSAP